MSPCIGSNMAIQNHQRLNLTREKGLITQFDILIDTWVTNFG